MKAQNKRKRRQSRQSSAHILPVLHVNSKAQVLYVEVENPSYSREHDGASGNPRKSQAIINMRESPALWMFSHNWIDQAQFEAAKHFRRIYEAAQGFGIQAMDYTKEPVDGGYIQEPITDRRVRAAKELQEVHVVLGASGYKLTESVCGCCIEINSLERTEWSRRMASKNLKSCLDRLASFWGYRNGHGKYYKQRQRTA